MRTDFTMIKEVLVLENILTGTQMYVVKGYGLKADPELLGNRISIMVNNISARKYPGCSFLVLSGYFLAPKQRTISTTYWKRKCG